ncbi:uncharacterized protein LOC135185611 isoform X2 [Pogoniulus pusillus]|uniref:uncharacterized protein LOC135185611 isoform X2 n=1 Tax=Pogoniulus pusillus TaxID=488313 RepID=UPI0030B96FCC
MSGEVCSSAFSSTALAAAGGALLHLLSKGNGSACPSPAPLTPLKSLLCVLWHQRVLIDRSQQPDAELDTDLRGQGPGRSADGGSLSQAVVPRHSTMRLWLLCSFAAVAAIVAVAGANHGDSKKGTRGREGLSMGGRQRPHRPCSGCFSVLSEESQSMPWHGGEDSEGQLGSRVPMEPAARAERTQAGGRMKNRHEPQDTLVASRSRDRRW